MSDSDGLVLAYIFDGNGAGKQIEWSDIDAWKPDDGILWVHLDSNADMSRKWLFIKSGLSELSCETLLEQETRPRIISAEDGFIMILRGVNFNPGEDPEDMVAIRMLFTYNRIISVRYRKVMAIQDINKSIIDGKGPVNSGDFLVRVAEGIADRMADIIVDLSDDVDALEVLEFDNKTADIRTDLANLRRKSISLRRHISPQKDVLYRLSQERISFLTDLDRAHIREVAERTTRFIEEIDSARERATITQEELNHTISEKMNRAVYTLSIITTIFLPLSLLTGLLGINVAGIPYAEKPWAFVAVSCVLVVISVVLVYLFKKIRWL